MFRAEMIAPYGLDCNICSQALIRSNPCQDMAVVYRFIVGDNSPAGVGSILVTNFLMLRWRKEWISFKKSVVVAFYPGTFVDV